MQALHRISHDDNSILSIAVSGQYIFAGTQSHLIRVHDVATYDHIKDLTGHQGAILSLILVLGDSRLLSSSGDSIIRIWDTLTLCCLNTIYSVYDVGDVFSTAYSTIHDTIYLGAQNTSIQWVRLHQDRPPPNRDAFPTCRPNKFFDSTGPSGRGSGPDYLRRQSTALDKDPNLIEIDKDDVIQYAHYSYVFTLLLGQYMGREVLFSGGGDAAINIWSLEPRPTQIRSLCQSQSSVLSLVQHESLLYAGHAKGRVAIWDLETNQLLRSFQAHDTDILAITTTRRSLVTIGASQLKIWNLKSAELIEEASAHTGKVLCLATGASIVTGGNDNQVVVWQMPSQMGKQESDDADGDFMDALRKFVSFQSVSGSGMHVEECRRAASFLKAMATDLGAEAMLLPTDNNPIVCIKFRANKLGATRSVLYYGHYDVVSADTDTWTTSPWQLSGHNGYLYARGVSDNKAPILSALFAAHELLVLQSLAVDLTFLIEGEEESGSRGFMGAISHAHESGIIQNIDEVFLSNSYWLDEHVPCLTYGLRGVIQVRVEISNDMPDLHSGVEGGSVREPTTDLINLLSRVTSLDRSIAIPGFHEPVRGPSQDEIRFYQAIAQNQLLKPPSNKSRTKLRATKNVEAVVEDLMNRWCRPSLTIHKVEVSGPGNSTVIPHCASSTISMRVVPDQEISVISNSLVTYLVDEYAKFKSENKLKIDILGQSDWWLSPPSSTPFRRLRTLVKKHWGIDALMVREGGSIPMIKWLEREFNATAVHFPMGQSSDQAHLVDERLRLLNLEKGRAIMKDYFSQV